MNDEDRGPAIIPVALMIVVALVVALSILGLAFG